MTEKQAPNCIDIMNDISKSQIKKLGRVLRADLKHDRSISGDNLNKLQQYRVLHQPPLRRTFDFLVHKSRLHYKGSLVVYRLKRIDTILRKINRYPTMDLATMQDIAGCRTIVDSTSQIYKIAQEFENDDSFEIIHRDNYIENPPETGYRSYHLIVRPACSNKVVEIQLRTAQNHHWATLVEITDLLFNIKLKEGQEHPDLFHFHKYLSEEKNKRTKEQREKIIGIERKYKIVSKLITVFRSNYYLAMDRWIEALPKEEQEYLIMELDNNLNPIFSFFKDFEAAENVYFTKFTHKEPEMVLIHANTLDFEKLGLAYSNYVLTSHPSIREYLELLRLTIKEVKKSGDLSKTSDLLNYLNELYSLFTNSISAEVTELEKNLVSQKDKSLPARHLISSWFQNLTKRLRYIKESQNRFNIELDEIKPRITAANFFKTFFN